MCPLREMKRIAVLMSKTSITDHVLDLEPVFGSWVLLPIILEMVCHPFLSAAGIDSVISFDW